MNPEMSEFDMIDRLLSGATLYFDDVENEDALMNALATLASMGIELVQICEEDYSAA